MVGIMSTNGVDITYVIDLKYHLKQQASAYRVLVVILQSTFRTQGQTFLSNKWNLPTSVVVK